MVGYAGTYFAGVMLGIAILLIVIVSARAVWSSQRILNRMETVARRLEVGLNSRNSAR